MLKGKRCQMFRTENQVVAVRLPPLPLAHLTPPCIPSAAPTLLSAQTSVSLTLAACRPDSLVSPPPRTTSFPWESDPRLYWPLLSCENKSPAERTHRCSVLHLLGFAPPVARVNAQRHALHCTDIETCFDKDGKQDTQRLMGCKC